MKIRSTSVLIMVTVGLLVLSGCNLPTAGEDALQTRIAGTVAAGNLEQLPAGTTEIQAPPEVLPPTLTATLSPTVTLTPTITASPTITLTSTLEAPMVSVSVNTNCRTGPDKIYDNIGALLVGEQAEVVGQTTGGGYWIIKNPDRSGECWLWGFYATVTGPMEGLPFYDPPPTPTPAFDWGGTWDVAMGLVGDGVKPIWTMNASVSGKAFTASIDYGMGDTETYTGTISDDYLNVSGTWTYGIDNGPFTFYALGVNQFQGNEISGMTVYEICGTKSGGSFPSPCYRP